MRTPRPYNQNNFMPQWWHFVDRLVINKLTFSNPCWFPTSTFSCRSAGAKGRTSHIRTIIMKETAKIIKIRLTLLVECM